MVSLSLLSWYLILSYLILSYLIRIERWVSRRSYLILSYLYLASRLSLSPSARLIASGGDAAPPRSPCTLKVHRAAPRTARLRACIRVGRAECRLACIRPECRHVGCRLTWPTDHRLTGCRLMPCAHPAWHHRAWRHREWRPQGRCLRACAHPACHTLRWADLHRWAGRGRRCMGPPGIVMRRRAWARRA